ncbi:glycosyl hydrolase family 25 [Streptococcus parasanguinis ATCC 903]|uniref:GBS Bsp-like repeat-containing protein n=1 Tax=Streptococcus parasanguinis TaxID=1318 RepID=A0AAX4AYQ4_STRPA|nr:GBS Bsp-like repeat-containing protein [Streptococcus parasanguinis]EFX38332.1 glycosyl hydrolase family 25 [Streptococcus parasanguinis ATCC 903]WNB83814.1 GBS Bsp-like repeat-containing protein [Streptococcus parasanguinis]
MKKKDLIFYAGAAVLMAVSAQGVSADELVSKEATTEGNQVQAETAPEVAIAEKTVAPVASNYAAPANVTEQPVVSASSTTVTDSRTPSVEKAVEASTTEKEEIPLPSDTGSTTFFNTGAHAPAGRSTDVAVQPKSFVDVSSHNGDISIGDYRTLANKGVGGVVVKLTEDTWYKNPNAENQIRNAQAAGLQVSTYHFSRYTSEEAARAEARFYIAAAQRLSLPKNTLMVNDFEDAKMQPNINRNTQAWADEMRKNGYTNLMFYTSASWLDENNLRKKGPVNTAQFGLQNFWVAQYPSPKLSVNDAKSLRYNGKAGAWQFTSQAELLPGKHLFDHSVDYTGRFTANAKPAADPTEGSLSGKIDIVNNDTMAGRFDVVISNVKAPNGVRSVSVPIWSETGGQDDLVWYTANRQANGTYTVNVKAADHKNSTGLYNVHLYYVQNNGQLTGVGGTTTNVYIGKRPEDLKPSGTLTIENNNVETGTFDAVIRNVVAPNGLKEVLVPIWSDKNWQDDLVWHKAVRQSDGSYRATIKASDHKNEDGKYHVHVYYVDQADKRNYITETTTEVHHVKPSGTVTIENNNSEAGTFDAVIRNVVAPNGLKEVLIPTWSDKNWQDDLVWHKAVRQSDGSYRATIKASDHKNEDGKYNVHVYYVDQNNQRNYITETTTYITKTATEVHHVKPSGTLTIENNNVETGTFDAVIRNVVAPNGLKEVLIPTWSDKNWQDDLVWHKAVRQSDGSYRATIKASDHKNDDGKYNVHVYYVDQSDKRNYITETTTEVHHVKPSGTLMIENNNVETGTFDAVIRNVVAPNGLKEVLIPTWSDKNWQDDLVWHKAVLQSDGSYRATIKASDHKNEDGKYNVHVYYVDQNNQRNYITETTTEVRQARLSGTLLIQNNNKDAGTFDVIIKDVYSPKGVRTVQVPTWSDKDGQDDIRWYEATRQSNGDYKVSVKASDHKNSTGKYHIHLYYIQNDGSRIGVGGTTTEIEFRNAQIKTQTGIKNVNSGAGTYTVTVDQAPQGRQIKKISVAVWSESNQSNLYWYDAIPTNAHTEVNVSTINHKNLVGNYTTHVYVNYVDGGVEGFNLGQTALHPRATVDQTAFSPRVTNGQRDRVLRAAASLVGVRGGSAAHHQLVNDYNSVRPLPVGYAVKDSDDWCDVFVTTIFQREGLSGLIGRECGVERHIQIFKRLGIWNENGASTPKAGDIITFNWDQDSQPNNGFADHIGIVESVSNGIIHTIEGNSGNQVRRNTYRIGHGNIRGFATPRYQ